MLAQYDLETNNLAVNKQKTKFMILTSEDARCSKGVAKIDNSKQELTLPGLVCQTGNGNGQTGIGQTDNGQTGSGRTGNGQTGYGQMVDRMEMVMVNPKVDGPDNRNEHVAASAPSKDEMSFSIKQLYPRIGDQRT
ncbi:Hypothetical predicted protein [Mytilus galloprovincialis]|uniref:Uncharacterized protein n=1 Tax=Mytilus galloprovincialis TaxID=29158 RepID=A0A8B6EQQ2_MYTGA|nr:Hypothetical predicted protein [Mytilus galloprovincialis]